MNNSLAGLTVVITRPAHQAQDLCDSITRLGGTTIKFPVIEIQPPSHPEALQTQLAKLSTANIAIFISANAVEAGIEAFSGAPHWPEDVMIGAVGRATANKLESYGLHVNLVAPEPYNTEALLALPELHDLTEQKIMIFRGEGGRELLAQTLRDRGADVEYVECYRRVIPASDAALIYQCWDESRTMIFVVTSIESLQNLVTMVDRNHREDLLSSPLVVVSDRAVNKAKELGFTQVPVVAKNASNEAILDVLQNWKSI